MRLTKTFRWSGVALLAGLLLLLVHRAGLKSDVLEMAGFLLVSFGGLVFSVSAFRHLMRGLLWRVGSRLLVSYALLVLPIGFFLLVVYAGIWIVSGQVAVTRLQLALERRQRSLDSVARDLGERFETAASPAHRSALFAEVAEGHPRLPGLGYAFLPLGGQAEGMGSVPAASLLPTGWIHPGRQSLLGKTGDSLFFASVQAGPGGILVLDLPAAPPLRQDLERELSLAIDLEGVHVKPVGSEARSEARAEKGKVRVSVSGEAFDVEPLVSLPGTESAAPPAGAGPFLGRWVTYPLFFESPVVDWSTGQTVPDVQILFVVRTSVAEEMTRLFGPVRIGRSRLTQAFDVAREIMKVLGITAAGLFFLASLAAGLLVLRISRTTRRLSTGLREIEGGNFAHRVTLRGEDQLAGLVQGFNTMAAHLQEAVAERASKEALEREVVVARDLQRRLLPAPDFRFPGVEIAVDFRPAAVIGGDFYDLTSEGESLSVVLADVSGHGLPTGIVMAAAKASLSALARTGADGARLLLLLDAEISRTTDSRTFVTLARLVFRLREGRVDFSNAGHLFPYRVEASGAVSALSNPARPLGLPLPADFRTVSAPLVPSDLWVLLSDGIVEALAPGTENEFGFARLEETLRTLSGLSAEAARDRILADWRAFVGSDEPQDDRTLVVLRIE